MVSRSPVRADQLTRATRTVAQSQRLKRLRQGPNTFDSKFKLSMHPFVLVLY